MSKKPDSEEEFIAKGKTSGDSYDQGLQSVQKRLAKKITEINLPFEDELENIDDGD